MTVHLIHGFNERHPIQEPKIACLFPLLVHRNRNVMIHDYGHWDLVATRNNENLARLIYPHVKGGDTLIGFSNGAAIIAHLQHMGVRTPHITLIQPALSKKWTPNRFCSKINVYWNPGDKATIAGKWWRRTTGILPWRWQQKHKWGEMGHTGYTGQDSRFSQYNTEDTPGMPVASGHGGWYKEKNRDWREFIVNGI